jgi:hypothetical protein
MSTFKAPKSTITVDGIELVGYRTESGQWVMSMTTLANVLNLTEASIRNFLDSEWLKTRLGKGSQSETFKVSVEGSNKTIVAIDTELAALFFRFQDSRNDHPVAQKLVDALMSQALNIRFEGTLTPTDTYQVVEKRALSVKEARQESVEYHQGFVNWYKACGYHGRWCHEYLTKQLANLTASEARKLPLCAGNNCKIGLDHYQDTHAVPLFTISQVKDVLSRQSYRSGESYQEAIDRAIGSLKGC